MRQSWESMLFSMILNKPLISYSNGSGWFPIKFQECDEADVETWMACDAEDCGFQTLNDDEIVTSVQEESNPVDDKTDEDEDNNNNESSKVP
ncbi:hypothetical protein TNCV_2156891 [Trichonephila clavipes]|nr:hypothetical protein TNCV_2156891 [Trichonephila clavipes]